MPVWPDIFLPCTTVLQGGSFKPSYLPSIQYSVFPPKMNKSPVNTVLPIGHVIWTFLSLIPSVVDICAESYFRQVSSVLRFPLPQHYTDCYQFIQKTNVSLAHIIESSSCSFHAHLVILFFFVFSVQGKFPTAGKFCPVFACPKSQWIRLHCSHIIMSTILRCKVSQSLNHTAQPYDLYSVQYVILILSPVHDNDWEERFVQQTSVESHTVDWFLL